MNLQNIKTPVMRSDQYTMEGTAGIFHKVSVWVMRAIYLNFLWILFTLTGLILIGIGPSTIAMFEVIRKLFRQKEGVSIFSLFVSSFRKNLLKGNIFFYFYALLAGVIYINFTYFNNFNGFLYDVISSIFVVFAFLLLLSVCYIGPVFSHYQASFFEYIKLSFLIPFIIPLESLRILAGLFSVAVLFAVLPGLLPFLFVSLPVFITSYFAQRGFDRVSPKTALRGPVGENNG
ncbi:YesL family protein [Pseudalkalibacillus sp. R45]|uniref:YesL family protein n=1 Tax=Pseudalkalibacillus sp. R45 TaxID=3457433 RepID=UPI003FCE4967